MWLLVTTFISNRFIDKDISTAKQNLIGDNASLVNRISGCRTWVVQAGEKIHITCWGLTI